MRYKDLLIKEAPLADYDTVTSPGSNFGDQQDHDDAFPERDRKLLKHPVHNAKLVKFFSKTPYDFNIIMYNGKQNITVGGEATGEVTDRNKFIELGFDSSIADKVFNNGNAITVVLTKNDSNDPMTPWIIAHRIGHAYDDHHKGQISKAVNKILRYTIATNYGISESGSQPVLAFLRKIMTSKAARTKSKLQSRDEAAMELFAEYILRDYITLNELPESLPVYRNAYAEPTEITLQDPSAAKVVVQKLEEQIGNIMNTALKDMVGKVFVY
jgi:hypothetical protein